MLPRPIRDLISLEHELPRPMRKSLRLAIDTKYSRSVLLHIVVQDKQAGARADPVADTIAAAPFSFYRVRTRALALREHDGRCTIFAVHFCRVAAQPEERVRG